MIGRRDILKLVPASLASLVLGRQATQAAEPELCGYPLSWLRTQLELEGDYLPPFRVINGGTYEFYARDTAYPSPQFFDKDREEYGVVIYAVKVGDKAGDGFIPVRVEPDLTKLQRLWRTPPGARGNAGGGSR